MTLQEDLEELQSTLPGLVVEAGRRLGELEEAKQALETALSFLQSVELGLRSRVGLTEKAAEQLLGQVDALQAALESAMTALAGSWAACDQHLAASSQSLLAAADGVPTALEALHSALTAGGERIDEASADGEATVELLESESGAARDAVSSAAAGIVAHADAARQHFEETRVEAEAGCEAVVSTAEQAHQELAAAAGGWERQLALELRQLTELGQSSGDALGEAFVQLVDVCAARIREDVLEELEEDSERVCDRSEKLAQAVQEGAEAAATASEQVMASLSRLETVNDGLKESIVQIDDAARKLYQP